jgi:hypothetical protein
MDHLSKLEESALAKFDGSDFSGAISDLSKVRLPANSLDRSLNIPFARVL